MDASASQPSAHILPQPAPTRANRQAGYVFAIQAAGAALLLTMHLVCARVLTPAEYGTFNYALTLANTLAIIACLGFQISLIRFVAEYHARGEYGLLRGLLRGSALAMALATIVLSLSALALGSLGTGSEDLRRALLLTALILPFITLGIWRSMVTRGLQQIIKAILPEELLRPLLTLVIVLAFAGSNLPVSAQTATFIYTGSCLFALVVGAVFLIQSIPPALRTAAAESRFNRWLRTSGTMLTGAVSQEIVNRSDVLLLGLLVSVEASGPYSVALRLALLNVFCLKIIDTLIAPKIAAAHFENRRDDLRKTIHWGMKLSALGALPTSLLLFAFPEFFLGLFGQTYAEAATLLRILVIGQFINGLTGPVGHTLLMTGHERTYMRIILTLMVANIGCHLLFIPQYGAYGAAFVTAGTVACFNLALFRAAHRSLGRTPA